MNDADFFRLCVHERVKLLLPLAGLFQAQQYLLLHVEELALIINAKFKTPHAHRAAVTEHLIRIAALCERAAVDLTIPASRAVLKKSAIQNPLAARHSQND